MSLFNEWKDEPERVFVIGDIHGCPEEVAALFEHLSAKENLTDKDGVIFIGDYVDRGPNSKGAIDFLIDFQKSFKNARFLKGNHEESFLDYCKLGGDAGPVYFYNGGVQFFQSYRFSSLDPHHSFRDQLPKEHDSFLQNLETGIILKDYIVVHAGIRPDVALEEQNIQDLLWIRDEFLAHEGEMPKTVIFGHTPLPEVLFEPGKRLGIDTGLVYGNRLSCVELKNKELYQVRRGGKKVLKLNLED